MTGDEIRRLIGSYATGSLSDAERKTLYEAALEDQELFDELAREHAFKELLEEPGAKQRLIAALSVPERAPASTAHGWRWATAALIAVSVVIAIVAGRNKLPPPPKPPMEIARMMSEPREPAAVPPEAPAPAPAAKPKPKATAPKAPEKRPESRADERSVSTGQLASPAAVPAPSQFVAPLARQTTAPGVGGAAPRAPGAAAPSFKAALMRAPRFAFDYDVEAGGTLMIKSAAAGYLRVAANSPTGTQVIFPATGTGRVDIDSVNRIPIPAGTQELVVTLLAQPASDSVPGLSSTSESSTGTIEDPNPSVNSKLVLTLRVHY